MREGLVQAASKSFWAAYTGTSASSIVFQTNNPNSGDGHTVVFDFDGNLSGKAIKGKDTAFGKGEQKKKFSDKITVERYRLVVDNGDAFDGVNIGDLGITQHSDSRAKLADLFVRFKDQAIFDAAQGFKDSVGVTHNIQLDLSGNDKALTYDHLVEIERVLKTGLGSATAMAGYQNGTFASSTAGADRAPLKPFRLADGRSIWLMVVDSHTAARIKMAGSGSNTIINLSAQADIRGNNNRVFRGIIGQIGSLVIVEADQFFGYSTSKGLDGSEIEIAGMRLYNATGTKWQGEAGFAPPATGQDVWSRNLILGAGAIQAAFGKMPDYKFQESQDFGIKSESAVEFWMNTQKTRLIAENDDYRSAKIAGLDHGVVAFDVKLTD
jgi:hypothetical protein